MRLAGRRGFQTQARAAAGLVLALLVACGGADGPTEPREDGEPEFGEDEWIYFLASDGALPRVLYRVRPDGTDEGRVFGDAGTGPVNDFDVAPGSGEIAVVAVTPSPEDVSVFDLWVVGPGGEAPRRVTAFEGVQNEGSGFLSPRWSPDGSRLAGTVLDPGADADYLGILSRDGAVLDTVTDPGGHGALHPRWSPDGLRLAYRSHSLEGKGPQIHLVDADGTADRRVTEVEAAERAEWAPDGSALVFGVWRDTQLESDASLYRVDGDGEGFRLLLATSGERGDPGHPVWSPSGDRIAFLARGTGGDRDVFVMAADGTDVRRALGTGSSHSTLAFSPDGRHLVADADGGGLWVFTPEGAFSRIATARRTLRRSVWVRVPPGAQPTGRRNAS